MKVLVIIPAYNEELNIKKVVSNLIDHYPQYNYVVVNDGSGDRTWEEIQKAGERDANVTGVLFSCRSILDLQELSRQD